MLFFLAIILNFAKSAILGQGDIRMANVYPCTRLYNTFIGDLKIWAKNKIQDGGHPILNFNKSGIF